MAGDSIEPTPELKESASEATVEAQSDEKQETDSTCDLKVEISS